MITTSPPSTGEYPYMPQIYIREDQYDELISLGFATRDDTLEFIRVAIDAALKKEIRKRKKAPSS
jgi:hypothetical protein